MLKLELRDRQREDWALLRQPSRCGVQGLAIFVHGFRGDYLTTWGNLPEYLLDHAAQQPTLSGWDYLFVGYSSLNIESFLDIAGVLATQCHRAIRGQVPFDMAYPKIALFGHSLGTLGIRQLLCAENYHEADILKTLHAVTLFGTPLNGSPWAPLASLVGYRISDALREGNPQLRMLKAWSACAHPRLKWKKVEVILGVDDYVVGDRLSELVKFAGDAEPRRVNCGHGNMVKPKDWENGSEILDELRRALS